MLQDAPNPASSDGLMHDDEHQNGLMQEHEDDMLIPADDLQVSQFDAGFGWGPALGNTGTGDDRDLGLPFRLFRFFCRFQSRSFIRCENHLPTNMRPLASSLPLPDGSLEKRYPTNRLLPTGKARLGETRHHSRTFVPFDRV